MEKKSGIDVLCSILRGLSLILAGVMVLNLPTGCQSHKKAALPDEGEKIVYSDTQYRMIQGAAVHRNSPAEGLEYVFIPLKLRNGSGAGIIFSTRACITAYALPSGKSCPHSHEAVMYGKEHIDGFRLFDGIIYPGRETEGWLAFELPKESNSVHIDFSTGIREGECLSFDCQL